MTSGEIAHRTLSRSDHGYGRHCLHITWAARGAIDVSALGLECVTEPQNADFILAHGTQGLGAQDGSVEEMALEELQELLRRCGEEGRARGAPLPLLLANPDVVTVAGCAAAGLQALACDGVLQLLAGCAAHCAWWQTHAAGRHRAFDWCLSASSHAPQPRTRWFMLLQAIVITWKHSQHRLEQYTATTACFSPVLSKSAKQVCGVCRGELAPMPGTLGNFYTQHCGGTTVCLGKPAKIIYDAALADLGVSRGDVVAVGDSLHHDICGAADAGIDSLFIARGIHEHDCDSAACGTLVDANGGVNVDAVGFLADEEGLAAEQRPTYVLDCLCW